MGLKNIGVITLFPSFFTSAMQSSVLGRILQRDVLRIHFEQIRDHAKDKHRRVDDAPYGGGAGQLMMAGPIVDSIEALERRAMPDSHVLLMSPGGRPLKQVDFQRYAKNYTNIMLVCGHYEGVDERIKSHIHEEVSIGDYVLTGGEVATLVFIDAVARLLPGALGNEDSIVDESFSSLLLEYPQYTRPATYRGQDVPPVLLSGNHGAIAAWRHEQALAKTKRVRSDLYELYLKEHPEYAKRRR